MQPLGGGLSCIRAAPAEDGVVIQPRARLPQPVDAFGAAASDDRTPFADTRGFFARYFSHSHSASSANSSRSAAGSITVT